MTRDEIIALAREATNNEPIYCRQEFTFSQKQLERFAALVAAAERERCARVCEEEHLVYTGHPCDEAYDEAVTHCAAAIRGLK